ncbi:Hsp33 family molecular chaperone HslO [Caldilinea sp.]|uniref:Hsp33 family molecular chaperone HslO n=1 Tax=Caldilinea sp. TaxID=2293560 RepID=UPI002CF90C8B|nr:Hsp33 family molecular chaperone HslO [Anaerolineales bacterium]HQY90151.1 Hsp33 family molecular chaperone HslO [Caldilinea sp.]HRA66247.1 Hsp33 family molecular chaperone HslO [Caldilinea sp.]
MNDYIVRVLARHSGIRGLACLTTGVVAEVARRHQTSPAGKAVLGYGLTGAALLGALLKAKQQVAIKVEGSSSLRKLVAEASHDGHVRGYISFFDDPASHWLDPADVATIIGRQGRLIVVKDLRYKDLYESVVPLQTGRLDADLTYYLMMSEQTPSFVEIDALVNGQGELHAAGGALLQILPGGDLATLARMAEHLDDLPPIGELLANGETPEDVLASLFRGQAYDVLETHPLEFRCTCSRERSRQALKLIGRAEIESLIAEGEAIIDCHFCHERYQFDRADLKAVLTEVTEAA